MTRSYPVSGVTSDGRYATPTVSEYAFPSWSGRRVAVSPVRFRPVSETGLSVNPTTSANTPARPPVGGSSRFGGGVTTAGRSPHCGSRTKT
ncbi:MAG: hypothetical protein HC918_08440 [Oscillatoriales cyanobacterium SM2_1_8]|nr:hypothetical protein [Oscillatoriales cyanobacterium SM2_1_8]